MSKNYDAIHIWGDESTTVWLRRKGTGTGSPTGLAEPTELMKFKDGGWLSEDGIDLEISANVEKFKAYQGGTIVKTRVTSTERSFKLQFLQEDEVAVEVFYGSKLEKEGDLAKYAIPKALPYREFEFLIDFVDGDTTKRLVLTAAPGERGTVPHKNEEMTVHEVTFDIIGDAYVLSDDKVLVAQATEATADGDE